jgi:deazaflavin-dependent oxidoreductase (nitroreductase family)
VKEKFIKWFMAFNAWLLTMSKGRLGNRLGKQTILLLQTTGRKSGKEHVIPIAYFEHSGQYIIVASNWDRESQANWYLNLKNNPAAVLGIRGKQLAVVAHEAEGGEYESLWAYVTERHPPYLSYQKSVARKIPVMVFSQQEYKLPKT